MSCFLCRNCFSARGPGFFSREIRVATNSIFFFYAQQKLFVPWSEPEQRSPAPAHAGLGFPFLAGAAPHARPGMPEDHGRARPRGVGTGAERCTVTVSFGVG